ncbi:MAG: type I DNA topoisomerase, partial [Oscillospiraceae bacterium]|nr:type I DNA topoisomerase [Oscillospiraceae bacterium]
DFSVTALKKGELKKNPPPPFTTSSMQQDASRKIGFSTVKTMQTAQGLYEGVNIGKQGSVGLITYMRTDSLRISEDAQRDAVSFIKENYGAEYSDPKQFKTKKNSQDAHEAIRPTMINLKPSDIKDKLTNDQFKLYKLIWERFMASQMPAAVFDTVNATLSCSGHTFKASGSLMKFKGYTLIYTEGTDEAEEKLKMLPALSENQVLTQTDCEAKQHFTQPPPRFTEASLVKELEENGIGRPSTYAPTISTIISRGYVVRNKKQLVPTELGKITTDIMKNNFRDIVDVEFTAGMEEQLDEVEDGKREWRRVIKEFYPPFEENLEKAKTDIAKIKIKDEVSDVICEKCGRNMVYKISKHGKFLACPGYPECKNTKSIRHGTGVECPKCGGEILIKKSKKGKTYYGCEHSPKCDFMLWDEPVKDEKCPRCGSLLLKKNGKNPKLICTGESCNYERVIKK